MATKTDIQSAPDDTYAGPRHKGEYDRLQTQHNLFKSIMGGKLVLAPVDLSNPSLQVLDSASADGLWLVDLASMIAPTAELCGADIAPQHFLSGERLPTNVRLFTQSIFDQWPDDCHGRFDLVHQRFVLPVCTDANSPDVLGKLLACLKPTGWIQIHDADFDTILDGPGHEAMVRYRDVMRKSWTMMGYNLSPGPKVAGWLRDLGAIDINEEILHVEVGAAAKDPKLGDMAVSVLLAALEGIEQGLGKSPDFFFSADQFDQLKKDLKHELETVGNEYRTHVVWAQRSVQ